MRLHLPVTLLKCLLAVCAATASAANLHTGVTMLTYTDFGQNMGRYAAGDTNALLHYIRAQEGGVVVTYADSSRPGYVLEHAMVDFSSQNDGGYGAAIGYNFYATVQHNGVHNNTYTGNYIGAGNAVHYVGVEYRSSSKFLLTPSNDYKITRQSKLLTDVSGSVVYGSATRDWSGVNNGSLLGEMVYRSGSGTMRWANEDGSFSSLTGAYAYITGGMMTISVVNDYNAADGAFSTSFNMNPGAVGINDNAPLPFASMGGDSGSPVWIWNAESGQYEYLNAVQSGNSAYFSKARGDAEWTVKTMEGFNRVVEGASTAEFHIGATSATDETVRDSDGRSTTHWKGKVTDANGTLLTDYIGVQTGINTWKDLSSLKDTDNWYAYGAAFFNAAAEKGGPDNAELAYTDLFDTQDLVFKAHAAANTITVDADTDLGLGYVRLAKASGVEKASYTLGGDHLLNSAGYVVDAGVDLHLQLTNSADYMREWRKAGEGDLYIEGRGNTNALLNVGGPGTTYLKREAGHAAYNVLANNGSKVVIDDIGQIERDFTFGFRGGVLDMNGNSMTWNNGNSASAEGFAIHALDEHAIVANLKGGSTTRLEWTQGGAQTFLGSFRDTAESTLRVVYNGGAGASLTLHGVFTDLQNADSGFTVQSGTVKLEGINTVHGLGSLNGYNGSRYTNAQDWHYADAAMNVTVQDGAAFELASHARLTGNVTVENGGTLILREGTRTRYEYVEGGYALQDTEQFADFYGLHGNIENNGAVRIEYSEGTGSRNILNGAVSGTGSLHVALGTEGATLTIAGGDHSTGVHTLESGGVILGAPSSAVWTVQEKGWLTADSLAQVAGDSTGAMALTRDHAVALDMQDHANLFVGAQAGATVQYGEAGTSRELAAWHTEGGKKQWLLGGGGGELVVNWKLSGDNDVVLGNDHMGGTVTLANTGNDFTGNIIFSEKGHVVLNYTDISALGGAHIDLGYGNAVSGGSDIGAFISGGTITTSANGILLLDEAADSNINLSTHGNLALGARGDVTYNGTLSIKNGGVFRFGGGGNLVVAQSLSYGGSYGIMVDGQGFSGGSVTLLQSSNLSGSVTVQGYDKAKGLTEGDISLILATDNALRYANVTVNDGGSLIAAPGTTQTFASLTLNEGGYLQADKVSIRGNYSFTLNTDLGDTVNLVELGTSSYIRLQGHTMGSALLATRSSTLYTDGGSLTNTVDVAQGYSLSVSNWSNTNKNVELTLSNAGENLRSGGTLALTAVSTLHIGHRMANSTQSFGGVVRIGNTTLHSINDAVENTTIHFDNLRLLSASNGAVSAKLTQEAWNTIWDIDSLNGKGVLEWVAGSDCGRSSILRLNKEGSFSGELKVNRNRNAGADARSHQSFLELGHDLAAQGAVINLASWGYRGYADLVLATDNAHIKGLYNSQDSKGYATVFAGSASEDSLSSAALPTSTRSATLSIDTDAGKSYDFSGSVSGSAGNAVSLVKSGEGTQTFSGNNAQTFGNVTVQGGTLALTGSHTTVLGDYAIAQGATLQMPTLSLEAGHDLAVLGGNTGGNATLGGTLKLAGGTLTFQGDAMVRMGEGDYLLQATNVTRAAGLTGLAIRYLNPTELVAGTYKLAQGDFSGLSITGQEGVPYFDVAYSGTSAGLSVTLALKSNTLLWKGTAADRLWTDSAFSGQGASGVNAFIFNDTAGDKTVQVSGTHAASSVVFDANDAYTVASNGGTVTVASLTKRGEGVLMIQGGLVAQSTRIESGRLELAANALSGSIGGDGTLAIANSEAAASLGNLSGSIGSLEVMGGATIDYNAAGRIAIGELVLGGGGVSMANGNKVSKLNVAADSTVTVASGTGEIAAMASAERAVLTKAGSGELKLTNKLAAGSVNVLGGSLNLASFDYLYLTNIKLGTGTKLLLTNQWTSIDSADENLLPTIAMGDNSELVMRNGNTNTRVNANVTVEGNTTIRGIEKGNHMVFKGSISGKGTLNLRSLADGQASANSWRLEAPISEVDGTLALTIADVKVTLNSINTYSGGTLMSSGAVTAASPLAFGSGLLTLNGGSISLLSNLRLGKGLEGSGGSISAADSKPILSIALEGAHSYAGDLVNLSLLVSGNGSQIFTKSVNIGALAVTGGASVTLGGTLGGALTVDGGTLTLNAGTQVAGGLSGQDATLYLGNGTNLGAAGATSRLSGRNIVDVASGSAALKGGIESARPGAVLVKQGVGTLALGGVIGTDVQVDAGTVAVDDQSLLGGTMGLGMDTGLTVDGALTVTGSLALHGAAQVSGDLLWKDGTLLFDGVSLSPAEPVLNFSGTSSFAAGAESMTLSLRNMEGLAAGSYTLASGDWSAVAGKVALDYFTGLDYVVSAERNGLFLTLSMPEGMTRLTYGNVGSDPLDSYMTDSDGVWAVQDGSLPVDLSKYRDLALGAEAGKSVTLTGGLTPAEGADYRFGGPGTLIVDCELGGERGLVVDAQGSTGGRIQLNRSADITGNVQVTGDITLALAREASLTRAASLTLGAGSSLDMLDGAAANTLALAGNATVNVGDGAASLNALSAAGRTLVKTGAGELALTSDAATAASVSIRGGALALEGADYTALGAVDLAGGAELRLGSSTKLDTTLRLGANGQSAVLSLGDSAALCGFVQGSGNLELRGGPGMEKAQVSAVFYNNISLDIYDANVAITGYNWHSGDITVHSGSLDVAGETAFGSGSLVLDGGTLVGAGNFTQTKISVTRDSVVDVSFRHEWGSSMGESGEKRLSMAENAVLTKTGKGSLLIYNNYAVGNFAVQEGVLQLGSAKCSGISSISLASGAELVLQNGSSGASLQTDIVVDAANGPAIIRSGQSGAGVVVSGTVSGGGKLELRGYSDMGTTQNTWILASAISGDLSLGINGAHVTISGDNSYTGGTVLTAGTLTVASEHALGTGPLMFQGGTFNLQSNLSLGGLDGRGTITGNGKTLSIVAEGDHSFGGTLNNVVLNVTGSGTQIFTGSVSVGNLNVESGSTANLGGNNILLNGVTSSINGEVTAAGLRLVDSNNQDSTLNIDGGKLVLTGNAADSLYIACWSSGEHVGTLNLSAGGLEAENAVMRLSAYGGAKGVVNMTGGGMSVKGIDFRLVDGKTVRGEFNLESGELTLGASGIAGLQSGAVLVLGDATLKAAADWTMGGDPASLATVELRGDTVFNTGDHTVTVQNKLAGGGSLTKDGEGVLILEGDTAAKKVAVNAGIVALRNGNVALEGKLTGAGSVVKQGGQATSVSLMELSVGCVAVEDGSLELAGVNQEPATMSGTEVLLANNTLLTLRHMRMESDSRISAASMRALLTYARAAVEDTPATVQFADSVLVLEKGGNVTSAGVGATLTSVTVGDAQLAVGTPVYDIACNAFENVALAGTLSLDLSSLLRDALATHVEYIVVNFGGTLPVDGLEVTALADGFDPVLAAAVQGDMAASGGFGTVSVYFRTNEFVPEPASGSLAVLALAALAARRRRKQ